MSGPVPSERPTFTREHGQDCARLVRQQHAPQLQGARATLALLLHARPERDSVTAARQRGRHPNWAYTWRKRRATSGFALTDRPGRGRPPAFPQRAVATVKALARELPTRREQPLSRYRPAAARQHDRAYPRHRCAPALAAPALAVPARPAVRRENRARPGPVRRMVGGRTVVAGLTAPSAPTRRRAPRRACAAMRPPRRAQARRCASTTRTRAAARWPTWPPGLAAGAASLAAARRRPAPSRSGGRSRR